MPRNLPAFKIILILGTALTVGILLFRHPGLITPSSILRQGQPCLPPQQTPILSKPVKRHNIAVASVFGYHFDVYMTLVWTLERVSHRSVQVYAGQPFHFNYNQVIDNLGLYNGTFLDPENLPSDLTRNDGIDLLIFGTCEIDLRDPDWNNRLLKAWDARDEAHKFQIVCMVHNVEDTYWQRVLPLWSRRNAIRFLAISERVKHGFREYFDEVADDPNPFLRTAGYEYIPVDVHTPVKDIPDLRPPSDHNILSSAVIQGTFSDDRRDYEKIFSELNTSLYRDPKIWGYLPLGDQPAFVVDSSLPDPPFRLYILGSGALTIPPVLSNVVSIHEDLSYTEYYAFMNNMDICIPAFANKNYFVVQASSTIMLALECNLPILVNHRIRAAYTFIDDDRVVVTRPSAMSELAAIQVLRTGDASSFWRHYPTNPKLKVNPAVTTAVEDMLHRGWRRSKVGFDDVKRSVWAGNDHVVEKLLRDL